MTIASVPRLTGCVCRDEESKAQAGKEHVDRGRGSAGIMERPDVQDRRRQDRIEAPAYLGTCGWATGVVLPAVRDEDGASSSFINLIYSPNFESQSTEPQSRRPAAKRGIGRRSLFVPWASALSTMTSSIMGGSTVPTGAGPWNCRHRLSGSRLPSGRRRYRLTPRHVFHPTIWLFLTLKHFLPAPPTHVPACL